MLRPAGVERERLHIVKMRKVAYLGHILRGEKYEVPKQISTGKMEGKCRIGRKQRSWMRNLHQWTGISDAETIFHLAEAGNLCEELKDNGDRPRVYSVWHSKKKKKKKKKNLNINLRPFH